jgi:hypothetical protein
MLRTTRSICRSIVRTLICLTALAAIVGLSGCALFGDDKPETVNGPVAKVLVGSYDEIWRATQKAFSNYPIQVNNLDQGILETDVIKGSQIWQAPFQKSARSPNVRYTISVHVIRGKAQGQESARVLIAKKINLQRDFFSGDEDRQSDGFEEISLLYRIERELQIERSLRKAFEKTKAG